MSERPAMAGDAPVPPSEPPPGSGPSALDLAKRYLGRFDEGLVVRWAFIGMMAGTAGVLGMDFWELSQRNGVFQSVAPPDAAEPGLPPAVETTTPAEPGRDPREFLTADPEKLKAAMQFALGSGGVMTAEGSIDVGAAARFAEEIAARGEYVKVVALNSPGGSLSDAMSMARLIRDKGLSTEVADGALCASSCPLILAGGVERRAGEKAAVGVHQFYAMGDGKPAAPAQAMSDAQATTARITRLLSELELDPALWLHALDTPPRELYYFTVEQMSQYRLTTATAPVAKAK